MSPHAFRSRAIDPIAAALAAACTLLTVLALARLIAAVQSQAWVSVAVAAALLTWFAVLTLGWAQAAHCRVRVDRLGIGREGQLGWYVLLEDIAYYDLVRKYGRTYLLVVPHHARRRRRSVWLLGDGVPEGALAAPIEPDLIPVFARAFAAANPPVRVGTRRD